MCERREVSQRIGRGMKLVIKPVLELSGAVAAVSLSGVASAVPGPGGSEFDTYMQALQRNGYTLTPDTALHAAQVAREGGWYATLPCELIPQEVVGSSLGGEVLTRRNSQANEPGSCTA
jgi:hypothetical protein